LPECSRRFAVQGFSAFGTSNLLRHSLSCFIGPSDLAGIRRFRQSRLNGSPEEGLETKITVGDMEVVRSHVPEQKELSRFVARTSLVISTARADAGSEDTQRRAAAAGEPTR